MLNDALINAKRIVVKIGTSTLTYENGKPNLHRFEQLARIVSDFKNRGKEVILVSSGAISVGVSRLGLSARPNTTKEKQAVSAVGQCSLMSLYDRAFAEFGYTAAQILLDRSVTEDAHRAQNVINTFDALLEMNAIPIVNENDSTSIEEIEFGDNDNLSATVAVMVRADALVILTDIDGLYDSDPKENSNAKLIPIVEEITEDMYTSAGGAGSNRGTGGMATKLDAAGKATQSGIDVVIAKGDQPGILYKVFAGEGIGTHFLAKRSEKNA